MSNICYDNKLCKSYKQFNINKTKCGFEPICWQLKDIQFVDEKQKLNEIYFSFYCAVGLCRVFVSVTIKERNENNDIVWTYINEI